MSEEISVRVVSYGQHRPLMLVYVDPLTGRRVAKSAETRNRGEALKAAGVWQDELRSGRYAPPSRITWADFRERVRREKLALMPLTSQRAYTTALDHLENILNPDRLAKVTAPAMTRFQTLAREGGMKATTLARNLRHIKACLRWAARQGMMHVAPAIEMPKLPKGQSLAKHRPVTGEEFDRLVEAAAEFRPSDSAAWVRLLRGLWLSGLRLGEALALSWDAGAAFAVDTTGKRPVFVIQPEGQKSRQAEVAPMTPDFAAFLLATPEAERVGRVFPLPDPETGREIGRFRVMHVVGRIARKARVVVGETEKAVKVDGEVERRTVKMYATSHDLRRAFCTRWSRRVMPAVLQRLARHAHVGTTMAFYVASTAEEIGADLWAAWGAMGDKKPPIDNTSDNKAPANACGADDSGQGVANVTDYTTEGSAQAEDTSRP